jgi:hypothetical protein
MESSSTEGARLPRLTRASLLAALLLVAATLSACGAGEVEDDDVTASLDAIRKATDKYKDVDVALKDGYRPMPACVESADDEGALGLPYTNLGTFRDQKIDLRKPEQLFYEPEPGIKPPTLVGVGYFVPEEEDQPPDTPLGRLDGPLPGGVKGYPSHYELHVWVHRKNPEGVLDAWNPDVKCP